MYFLRGKNLLSYHASILIHF